MSATSWQLGTNYHDSNPFLKNTSNSSYGQWFGGGPSAPVAPSVPPYATIGPRAGRKLGGFHTSVNDSRFSTVTSRDVQEIVSSAAPDDPKDKFTSFISRYGSGKITPVSEYERIMAMESDAQALRRPMLPPANSPELYDDFGLNDLKLSPRAPVGGTLGPLSPSRSSTGARRYDLLESKASGSAYDPLKIGLEKSRTSLGLTSHTSDTDYAASNTRFAPLEKSNTFHGTFNPSPPSSRFADTHGIPSWRSRYHNPSPPGGHNERPISSMPSADRPLIVNTSLAPLEKSGVWSPSDHQPSSPLTVKDSLLPTGTEFSATSRTGDLTADFRSSRQFGKVEEAADSSPHLTEQTRPMYWLYGSRGRPNTPYSPSTYSYKPDDTFTSRLNEAGETSGHGDFSRFEYTRDLGSGLPKQNSFSTGVEHRPGDYASKLAEYSPNQYSPSYGSYRASDVGIHYDTSISHPPPPGSPAKRSILKKTSSYSGGSAHYSSLSGGAGMDPAAHFPPLSAGSSRKKVTFNHQQTYHPV